MLDGRHLKVIFLEGHQWNFTKFNNITWYGSKELTEHGCFLGSAAIVVLSDKDSMKEVGLNLLNFLKKVVGNVLHASWNKQLR